MRCHCARPASAYRQRQEQRGNRSFAGALRASANVETEVEYVDSWSDIAFIALCRKAYGNIAGWQSQRDWKDGKETYAGMVEVSRALMKVRSFQMRPLLWGTGYSASDGKVRVLMWDAARPIPFPLNWICDILCSDGFQFAFAFVQGRTAEQQRNAVIAGFPGVPCSLSFCLRMLHIPGKPS